MTKLPRNPTREVKIGSLAIGGENPISIQSMCSTRTQNIATTIAQIKDLEKAGAGIIRLAIDSMKDVQAIMRIAEQTSANLCVDLQENYRLAEDVAPYIQKIRYNPGHLYHHERDKPWQDKVKFLADVAAKNDCAIRVGVNCGSVDPDKLMNYNNSDTVSPMVNSAYEHCELLDSLGFTRYCVSLKDSDPIKVIELNRLFARQFQHVPLHLGVTEAGMLPDGAIKTRIAFEQLISQGIGDTIRVSLTVPNHRKAEEIKEGKRILEDIINGRVRSVVNYNSGKLNIISCPSCSRVENEAFINLAEQVKDLTRYAENYGVTIAIMGCRVNGPGETDQADLGLWCGSHYVNLKHGTEMIGSFTYDAVLIELKRELDKLISEGNYKS